MTEYWIKSIPIVAGLLFDFGKGTVSFMKMITVFILFIMSIAYAQPYRPIDEAEWTKKVAGKEKAQKKFAEASKGEHGFEAAWEFFHSEFFVDDGEIAEIIPSYIQDVFINSWSHLKVFADQSKKDSKYEKFMLGRMSDGQVDGSERSRLESIVEKSKKHCSKRLQKTCDKIRKNAEDLMKPKNNTD